MDFAVEIYSDHVPVKEIKAVAAEFGEDLTHKNMQMFPVGEV